MLLTFISWLLPLQTTRWSSTPGLAWHFLTFTFSKAFSQWRDWKWLRKHKDAAADAKSHSQWYLMWSQPEPVGQQEYLFYASAFAGGPILILLRVTGNGSIVAPLLGLGVLATSLLVEPICWKNSTSLLSFDGWCHSYLTKMVSNPSPVLAPFWHCEHLCVYMLTNCCMGDGRKTLGKACCHFLCQSEEATQFMDLLAFPLVLYRTAFFFILGSSGSSLLDQWFFSDYSLFCWHASSSCHRNWWVTLAFLVGTSTSLISWVFLSMIFCNRPLIEFLRAWKMAPWQTSLETYEVKVRMHKVLSFFLIILQFHT